MLSLRFFRIYETGQELDLDALENQLSESHSIARSRFSRVNPKSIVMDVQPLLVKLDSVQTNAGQPLMLFARARIFDIGAISICLEHRVKDPRPGDLELLALKFTGQKGLDDFFASHLRTLQNILAPDDGSLQIDTGFFEDYNVYWTSAADSGSDPVAVLMGETASFSHQMRSEILKNNLSYSTDDSALISWDSAWLVDPEDPTDLVDLIEYANVQLLELRYYDRQLTDQVGKMYDHMASADNLSHFRRLREYHQIMADVMEFYADITETTEKIKNLLKITEDIYYARVYAATLNVLRSSQWTDSVNRKIEVIHRNYTMLSNEVNIQHSNSLEWMIIVLIALEFGWAIWQSFL